MSRATVFERGGAAPTEPGRRTVRDPLASDLDDRVHVRMPAPEAEPVTDRQSWPITRRDHRLPIGWPIGFAIAGWPVWWALGLTSLVFPLCAIPVAWQLIQRRRVRVPAGFWIWVLFLTLVLLSVMAIDVDLAGTVKSEGSGRYFAFGFRFLNYLAITLMLLFVGNTSEEELPRRRIIRWFAALAIATIALGALSLFAPDFGFVAPSAHVLPGWTQDEGGGLVTLSQLQPILGDVSPRPSAPFAFTNAWGNNLSLLLVWIVVAWGVLGRGSRRLWLCAALAVAVVPIVFSLNRAMWIGIGLAVVVVTCRLALRGRGKALAVLVLVLVVGGLAFAASPLKSTVDARLEAGHSNEIRGSLLGMSVDAARESPVIGFGSTRAVQGSDASIAIGPSEGCPRCGSRNIGSTGQLTLLLISQGFLGVALYGGFLVHALWRYRRDCSVIGIAGTTVVLLQVFYAGFYSALTMPLAITFLSIGLLWRNEQLRQAATS